MKSKALNLRDQLIDMAGVAEDDRADVTISPETARHIAAVLSHLAYDLQGCEAKMDMYHKNWSSSAKKLDEIVRLITSPRI